MPLAWLPARERRVLLVLAIIVGVAAACGEPECSDDNPGRCGVLKNHVFVVFKDGTTRERVDAINAEIGATVVIGGELTTAYRIKLPEGWCYERGVAFYETKPQVVAASWAVTLCPD